MNRSGSMFKKGIVQNLNLPFLIPNLLNFFFPSFKINEFMYKTILMKSIITDQGCADAT